MALRVATRALQRRLSTTAETAAKPSANGPRLPPGNDPSASHGPSHAMADTSRWRVISAVCALPVLGFAIIQSTKTHEHAEAPPEYPYLKMASRVPRFPWGNDDLIGTGYERHAKQHAEADH